MSRTGVVGFIGGMDIPLIHKFEAASAPGPSTPSRRTRSRARCWWATWATPPPLGTTRPRPRRSPQPGAPGADIIYAAAGGSGLGLIDYVKQAKCLKEGGNVKFVRKADPYAKVPKYADYTKACGTDGTKATPLFFIGVDANQNYLGDTDNNPNTLNHGLTSMMKRVDVATYEVIKSVVQKAFKGGVREFGLANNGVATPWTSTTRP